MASENLYLPLRRSVDEEGGGDLLFSAADQLLPSSRNLCRFSAYRSDLTTKKWERIRPTLTSSVSAARSIHPARR